MLEGAKYVRIVENILPSTIYKATNHQIQLYCNIYLLGWGSDYGIRIAQGKWTCTV